tara:strand:- start:802 stop:990 length:189 start_codon:yes stop_codon:yes gene_type:complete
MGSKLSQCFGLQYYSPAVGLHENYVVHPGQTPPDDVPTAVALVLDEDCDENPETFFYQGTEV